MTAEDYWARYRNSDRVYLPAIKKALWVRRFAVGPYEALLGTACESVGPLKYHHVLNVYSPGRDRPYLVVASEYDAEMGDAEKPFLTIFFGGVHFNQGASADWRDLSQFTEKALEALKEPLQVTDPPSELPLNRPSPADVTGL